MVMRETWASCSVSETVQGFDVVAAPGEQADDPGEDARLVVDDNRQGVRLDRILAVLEK